MKYLMTISLFLANFISLFSANNLPFEIVKNPSATNSLASNLFSFGDSFGFSWIERGINGDSRFYMASWNGLKFDEKCEQQIS